MRLLVLHDWGFSSANRTLRGIFKALLEKLRPLVTGPVTLNMREAVLRAYNATPTPQWVIAAGACAIDGHVFKGSYAIAGGAGDVLPVDVSIPGCPPSPKALLRGLLAVMGGAAAR